MPRCTIVVGSLLPHRCGQKTQRRCSACGRWTCDHHFEVLDAPGDGGPSDRSDAPRAAGAVRRGDRCVVCAKTHTEPRNTFVWDPYDEWSPGDDGVFVHKSELEGEMTDYDS